MPIIAKETESFTIFSLNSIVLSANAENAVDLKKDNEIYEYFTFGEGKYKRKLQSSEQQTIGSIKTSESTCNQKKPTKNDSTWVTNWKIVDEYMGISDEKK